MAFGHVFEKEVNDNMQDDGQPGASHDHYEADLKKGRHSIQSTHEDAELHQKKDCPPRFSTLFAPSQPQHVQPQREYLQEYYPPPEKKSGVFMPMPLFIVFAVILFFESTILFAYTVIGLYNNAPSRLFPWAGQGSSAAACNCGPHEQQPSVNIAPNFVLPQAGGPAPDAVTITIQPTTSPSSTNSSSTSGSTTTEAAAIASDIAGILGGLASSSSSSQVDVVTVTPPRSTVHMVVTATPDSSDKSSATPPPTVTQTTLVPSPSETKSNTPSSSASSSSDDAAARASISSAIAADKSIVNFVPTTTETPTPPPPTTLETSTTLTTKEEPAKTLVSSATGKVCFGGSGAVQLVCE